MNTDHISTYITFNTLRDRLINFGYRSPDQFRILNEKEVCLEYCNIPKDSTITVNNGRPLITKLPPRCFYHRGFDVLFDDYVSLDDQYLQFSSLGNKHIVGIQSITYVNDPFNYEA